MIDIKYIRENPEFIKKNCEIRGSDVDVDAIVALDKERREVTQRAEFLRSERNRLSKECKTNPAARDQVKAMKDELSALEEKERELNVKVDEALSWLPNILDPEVPMGKDDADNKEIRKVGTIRRKSPKSSTFSTSSAAQKSPRRDSTTGRAKAPSSAMLSTHGSKPSSSSAASPR